MGTFKSRFSLHLQSRTSITLSTGPSSTSSGWISGGGGDWSNSSTSAAAASQRVTTAPSVSANRTPMEATPASSQVETVTHTVPVWTMKCLPHKDNRVDLLYLCCWAKEHGKKKKGWVLSFNHIIRLTWPLKIIPIILINCDWYGLYCKQKCLVKPGLRNRLQQMREMYSELQY